MNDGTVSGVFIVKPIPEFLGLNHPVKESATISLNRHNTQNSTVKRCLAGHVLYNSNFAYGAILRDQKIAFLNLYALCFFPAFHRHMDTIFPIDAAIKEVDARDKECSFILIFLRSQTLPADTPFEICHIFDSLCIPAFRYRTNPADTTILHGLHHSAPRCKSSIFADRDFSSSIN